MEYELFTGFIYNKKEFSQIEDHIASEVALSIAVNGTPYTVTMQTPGSEKELIRGLLFTENIYRDLSHKPVYQVRDRDEKGNVTSVNVSIPEGLILRKFAGMRNLLSVSSCGVCGKSSLDEWGCDPVSNNQLIDPLIIPRMFRLARISQKNFHKTGGTHAASAFTINGRLLTQFEDVGRHNAVDKVIGALIEDKLLSTARCLVVSGRISYEIVSKSRSAGIPFLASVSAPSTLAIDYARETNITLLAFCRKDRFTIYSNPQQVAIQNTNANPL